MYGQKSRRKSIRYTQGNLFVMVKRQGFIGVFRKPHVVNWMDFNQLGMAFVSEYKYNIDNELLLELTINDVNNKESLSEVVGRVVNATREPTGNFRYGIKFDFNANEFMKSDEVKRSLSNIELLLKNIFSRLNEKRKS